jgi:hypothetical protein
MNRIDEDTAAKIRTVLLLCRSKGVDPVTALDNGGFLSHPSKRDAATRRLLDNLIVALTATTATDLGFPGTAGTPMDMKRCIIEWLEGMRNSVAEK